MRRRIDAGELVAALGGGLVLVALFLDWFGPATGWEVFETLDLLLTALAATAIATVVSSLGASDAADARWLLPVGLALVAIVVVQIVEPPPVAAELDVETGAWLALAGALLVLAGGVLRVSRIDVTVTVGPRDARTRVPAVDRRPNAEGAGAPADAGDERPAPSDSGARAAPERPRRSLLDDAGPGPHRGRVSGADPERGSAAAPPDEPPPRGARHVDPDATQPLEPVERKR